MKARDPRQLAYEIADSLIVQLGPLKACGFLPDRDGLAGVFFPIARQQAAMDKEIRRLRKEMRGVRAAVAEARGAPQPPVHQLVGLDDAAWSKARQSMTCLSLPEANLWPGNRWTCSPRRGASPTRTWPRPG